MKQIVWTVKDIVEILKERQVNEFDGNFVTSGNRGDGKTQIKGDKVLMYNGRFKNIEDVKVGETVISPQFDGTYIFSKVIGTHSHFEKDVYEVREQTRNNKLLYTCSKKHDIPIIKIFSKRTSKDDSTPRIRHRKLCKISAEKMSKRFNGASQTVSFSSTSYETSCLIKPSVDPYCLGAILGNGSFCGCSLSLTSEDKEIINYFNKKYKIIASYKKKDSLASSYRFSTIGKLGNSLRRLGLHNKRSGDKFIPKEYIDYSISDKFKLLAGLIDTDGFVSKNNQLSVCTKSYSLARDIENLVFSLGGYSLIRNIYKKCPSMSSKRLYYDVSVQFEDPRVIPLKLLRKKNRLRKRAINPRNIAIKCIRTNPQMVYGIEINSPSRWYVTNNHMITHNSTLINKILYRFTVFTPWKHQVYSREEVIKLLKTQEFGICWDDEAINSGYKRNFQNKGQQELIKILTAYRDNYNIYASAIPNFFSLDKDLRDLCFIHLHVIERGIAVVHMPLQGKLYSQDRWDIKYNAKVEESWSKRIKNDPSFSPPYHKLTTFRGYLYFSDLTDNQKELYKKIKKTKRDLSFQTEEERKANIELSFIDKVYNQMINKKLTKEGLAQICILENKKYSSISSTLNRMLKDNGLNETVKDFLRQIDKKPFHSSTHAQINQIVPDI